MEYAYILFLIIDAFMVYRFMYKDNSMKQKLLSSNFFVLAGVYLLFAMKLYTSVFSLLIVLGLIASFVGDWALRFDAFGMKGLPGIIAFATAHIFYISAFAVRVPLTLGDLFFIAPWLVCLITEICVAKKLRIPFEKTAPAVLIYAMIINTMVILGTRTALLTLDKGIAVLKSIILIVGVLLFIISDAGVCLMMFAQKKSFNIGKKTYSLNSFNCVTYYGGQMLIAASVMI